MSFPAILGKKKRPPNLSAVTNGSVSGIVDATGLGFHPNGNFVAVATAYSSTQITVWSWNGTTTIAKVAEVSLTTSEVYCVRWHQNGNYLAVNVRNIDVGGGSIKVYSWNGSNALTLAASITISPAEFQNFPYAVDWHPSGNFLSGAIYSNHGRTTVAVYSWNGSNTLTAVATVATGSPEIACVWSPSGNYLYTGGSQSGKGVKIYSWNGSNALTEVAYYNTGNYPDISCWTSDDAYLFVPQPTTTTSLYVFKFDGSSLVNKQTLNLGLSGYEARIYKDKLVSWAGYQATPGTPGYYLKLYTFDRTSETLTEVSHLSYTGYGLEAVEFNPSGTYIAVAGCGAGFSLGMVKIYS
jgi:6-phosphogluconolactonase (cycloisomerase 2 family)